MPCGHHSYEPFLRDAVMSYIKQVNPQFYHATTAGSLTENGAKQFWLSIYDLPQVEKCGASLSLSLSLSLVQHCAHTLLAPMLDRLRELKTAVVGKLLTISATVTRTSEVRPELIDASFDCQACGTTIDGIVQQFKYTEVHSHPQCFTVARTKTARLLGAENCCYCCCAAANLHQSHLWQPQQVGAADGQKLVRGLPESSGAREQQRDPGRIHAAINGHHSSA
jgi:DNA replicative helicase MCM subunit Mcm2 (Cdc46/Mcm family)